MSANPSKQSLLSDFVAREVIYCVSALVSDMTQKASEGRDYDEQITALWDSPPDYKEAATQAGWWLDKSEEYLMYFQGPDTYDGYSDWQELCEAHDIDADEFRREIYEHWIVTDWLADKLAEQGEVVVKDFHGLTIWGRPTTGQAIYMDAVIERIYDALDADDRPEAPEPTPTASNAPAITIARLQAAYAAKCADAESLFNRLKHEAADREKLAGVNSALLSALEELVYMDAAQPHRIKNPDSVPYWITQARAAIAKARGQS